MMQLELTQLRDVARRAIAGYGYTEVETQVILEILLYAQMRDSNQGVVKLVGQGIPKDREAGEISVEKETELSAVLNGNRNAGMIVMWKAMTIAMEKAASRGLGIVGTNRTASSTGALGYYACECAKRGFVALVFSRSREIVSPYGSYEPVFGTNPLSVGIPTREGPFVLDMSTAAITYYGLIESVIAQRPIPEDSAYNSKGKPTDDPSEAIEGAVRTFDRSYKGSGLAMVVEILAGPLVGAGYGGAADSATNWGNLILVIDPRILGDAELFRAHTSELIHTVRNAKRLPATEDVLVPGERGNRLAQRREASGRIEIEENLFAALRQIVGE